MKPLFVAVAALLATLTVSERGEAQIMDTYSLGYPIQIRIVSIADGEEVKFRTDYTLTSAPGGAFGDTVLSLVEVGGGYLDGADSWDCAGLPMKFEPSCFKYKNTSGSTQVAYLIARAWRSFTPSLTRLYRNDTALLDPAFSNTDPVFVGGGWSPATFYTWARNHVTTAFMPGDAASHILIAGSSDIFGSPEVVYRIFDQSNVVPGLAEIDQFGISGLSNSIGVAYGGYNGTNEGPLRLLKNDWFWSGRDYDEDGLGHDLEIDLGTCDRPTDTMPNGESCSSLEACDLPHNLICLAHLRDTDHDGLRDDVEVYGYDHMQARLPLWGADPVHRDVFIEMNTSDRQTSTPSTCEGFDGSGVPARDPLKMGGETGSDNNFFDRAQRIYAQAPAWMNPDGTQGINLHFDVGVENPDPATATLWGDWGGGGDCLGLDDIDVGARYASLCANDIEADRSWLFHCAIDTALGAGQADGPSYWASTTGQHVHELSHVIGLDHSGGYGAAANTQNGANNRPLYFSRANYRYALTGDNGMDSTVWDAISFNFSPPDGTPMSSTSRGIVEVAPLPGRDLTPVTLGGMAELAQQDSVTGEWEVDWNHDLVYDNNPRVQESFRDTEPGRNARGYKADAAHEGLTFGDYGVHMDATVLDDMLIFAFSEGGQIYLMVDSDGECNTFPSSPTPRAYQRYGDCMKMGTRIDTGLAGDAVSIAPTIFPLGGPVTVNGLVVVYSDDGDVEWAIVPISPTSGASEASILVAPQGYLGSVDHPVTLVEVPASLTDPHGGLMAFWSPAGGGALQQMHLPVGTLTWSARQNVRENSVDVGPVAGSVGAVAHKGMVYTATRTVGGADIKVYEMPAGADENDLWNTVQQFQSLDATDVEIAFTDPPTNEMVDEIFIAFNVPLDGSEVVRQRRSRGIGGLSSVLAAEGESDMGLTSYEYAFASAAMVYDRRNQGLKGLRAYRSTHRGCGGSYDPQPSSCADGYHPGTQSGDLVCEGTLCLDVPLCFVYNPGGEGCACASGNTCNGSLSCTVVYGGTDPWNLFNNDPELCVDLSPATNPPRSYIQYLPFAEGHNPTEYCEYDDWRQMAFYMCLTMENRSAPTVSWDSHVAPYQLTPDHLDGSNIRCGNRYAYREADGTGECVQSYTVFYNDRNDFPGNY